MFQFIPMQAEITLAAMMVIILLADLIMKCFNLYQCRQKSLWQP